MKKFVLLVLTALFYSASIQLQAQCNPITTPCTNGAAVVSFGGLCDTTLADGTVGVPYNDNIQFYIEGVCFDPNDVGVPPPIPGVTARITRLHSFTFTSLPNGITGGTNQIEYIIASGATVFGCGYFVGTPSQAGQFAATIGISGDYTTAGCFFFTQTGTAPVSYNINYNVLPNASFSGLTASYCEINPSATLTPTGTMGGTFSGPGVSGNTFNPAVAGVGTHTITYTVTAQEGNAVGPATNSSSQTVTVTPSYIYYADTDMDTFGDPMDSIVICSSNAPAGYVTNNMDCAPTVNAVNPNATEICDGIDNNCNGQIDEGLTIYTYYADTDNDNYGDPNNSIDTCLASPPSGYVADSTDCAPTITAINPGASEVCDGIDNNCDGQIDEGLTFNTYYADTDNDNFGDPNNSIDTCLASAPAGFVADSNDCNDNNMGINPNATDIPGNSIDEDCDGSDATVVVDNDNDGFDNTVDCNDNDSLVYPGAPEICDGIDNNCVNGIDEGLTINTYYADSDMDGYGNSNDSITTCATVEPNGYVIDNTDCDDQDSTSYPGAPELCDGVDNDCNGQIDDNIPLYTYYYDEDGDGFGYTDSTIITCNAAAPIGFSTDSTDCNNQDFNINPSVMEICDGIDNNCSGAIDDGLPLFTYYYDADFDGFGTIDSVLITCSNAVPNGFSINNTDCNDLDININPNATEICDGIDNNCSGFIDDGLPLFTYYVDADNDGFGSAADSILICSSVTPAGYATDNTDCDDTNLSINPGSAEFCDSLDNNCNGQIDEGLVLTEFYVDADNDGFGNSSAQPLSSCASSPPTGYSPFDTDCDDTDNTIFPGAIETPDDGIDQDCDPATSIGDLKNDLVLNIYPNPTHHTVTIQLERTDNIRIQLFDMNGKQLKLSPIVTPNEFILDLNSFIDGIYLVKITSDNGSYIIGKILKSN